jgi:tetratricopeptide (TPR) repeat protein
MSASHRVVRLEDVEEIPVDGGALRWKPLRRTLGIRAFGMNAYAAEAGAQVIEEHDEVSSSGSGGHEEVYLVAAGRAEFTVGGETFDVPAGALVFLPDPAVRRGAVAREDGTIVVAVGGEPGKAYEISPWEYYFAAEGPAGRGDYAGAVEIVREALPEHDGNPRIHYALACFLARDGQHDEAMAQLERALAGDPERIAAWAAEDDDLAALRERPGFPRGAAGSGGQDG